MSTSQKWDLFGAINNTWAMLVFSLFMTQKDVPINGWHALWFASSVFCFILCVKDLENSAIKSRKSS